MPDYGGWIQRLRKFSEDRRIRARTTGEMYFRIDVVPPLDGSRLKNLEEQWGSPIPPPPRDFVSTGASSLTFQWFGPKVNEPEFEVVFCPAEAL
jgi:hypothetical protein